MSPLAQLWQIECARFAWFRHYWYYEVAFLAVLLLIKMILDRCK